MPNVLSASAAAASALTNAAVAARAGLFPGSATYPGAATFPGKGTVLSESAATVNTLSGGAA